jgi:hypothetical protein
MKLPVNLIQELTRRCFADPATGTVEQRSESRHIVPGHAVVIACPARFDRRPVIAAVRDLSTTGIGLIHSQRIENGEQFILRMPLERGPIALLCTVTYCKPVALGIYALGAFFVREINPNATTAPTDSQSPSAPPAVGVVEMSEAFSRGAAAGMTPEEREQLQQMEERLRGFQAD